MQYAGSLCNLRGFVSEVKQASNEIVRDCDTKVLHARTYRPEDGCSIHRDIVVQLKHAFFKEHARCGIYMQFGGDVGRSRLHQTAHLRVLGEDPPGKNDVLLLGFGTSGAEISLKRARTEKNDSGFELVRSVPPCSV